VWCTKFIDRKSVQVAVYCVFIEVPNMLGNYD